MKRRPHFPISSASRAGLPALRSARPHGTDCDHLVCLIQIPDCRFPLALPLLKAELMLRLFQGMQRGYFSACLRAARKHGLNCPPVKGMCIMGSFRCQVGPALWACGRRGLTTPRTSLTFPNCWLTRNATTIDRSFSWHGDFATKGARPRTLRRSASFPSRCRPQGASPTGRYISFMKWQSRLSPTSSADRGRPCGHGCGTRPSRLH